ncbi:hypothetical protein DENIS_2613 [Desulfonema ishimotonii]|uniref:Uncharacterized protein n=1 Tax=Desulfonema ishimotonii TaxID=45657 RepID=A0A401FXG2_9BACT|nr:choice-of-anchor K domain-containing protein [Desulfonema ishimotonii]GBC61651.1 hypothetical protein DENIS_2613 [Desulfonema ishimotonii]
MKKLAKIAMFWVVVILSAFFVTGNAYAVFNGSVSGNWADPVPEGSSPVFEGVGTSYFKWGDASFDTPPCHLKFEGYSFSNVSPEIPFKIGKVSYYNGTTGIGTDASSVNLILSLDIQAPIQVKFTPKFSLGLINVPNDGAAWENADYVHFPSSLSNEYITLGGTNYKLEIIGFSQDGGATTVKEFHVLEDNETSAELYGRITQGNAYYLPFFVSGNSWWTGVALKNFNESQNANISVVIRDKNGNTIKTEETNLSPKGQNSFIAGSGLDTDGWIEVKSDQRLGGLCFFGRTAFLSYMTDIPFVKDLATKLCIPHVAQNQQWDTLIMICNPNQNETTGTISMIDWGGNTIAEKNYTIPANGSGLYELKELLGNTEANGSVEITATQGIAAFGLYSDLKSDTGMDFAGIAAVDPTK